MKVFLFKKILSGNQEKNIESLTYFDRTKSLLYVWFTYSVIYLFIQVCALTFRLVCSNLLATSTSPGSPLTTRWKITWFPFDHLDHLVWSPGSPLTTRWKCLKIEMEQQIMSDERCETRNNKCQMTNVRWKMTIVSRYSLYLYISRLTLP